MDAFGFFIWDKPQTPTCPLRVAQAINQRVQLIKMQTQYEKDEEERTRNSLIGLLDGYSSESVEELSELSLYELFDRAEAI